MADRVLARGCLAILLLSGLLSPPTTNAADLTIDPSSITSEYPGPITFNITGLT